MAGNKLTLNLSLSTVIREAQLIGRTWRMETASFRNVFLLHRNSRVRIDRLTSGSRSDLDSSWDIVPGLCDKGISFRSKKLPRYFIRHKGSFAYINKFDRSALFKKDACFIPRAGLINPKYFISFESVNYPNYFLRNQGSWVRISKNDNSASFKKYATWKPRIVKGNCYVYILVIFIRSTMHIQTQV